MGSSLSIKVKKQARERDNYKCIKCGKTTGLEGHHIIPKLEEIDNIMTLCHSCHKKEHNMAGCFKNGFDERRKILSIDELQKRGSAGGKKSTTCFKKGEYFHVGTKEWVGR